MGNWFLNKRDSFGRPTASVLGFFITLGELSPLELLSGTFLLPAFALITAIGLFRYPINALNLKLKREKASRLTKIVCNLILFIPFTIVVIAGIPLASGFLTTAAPALSMFLLVFSAVKLQHHIRQYFKYRSMLSNMARKSALDATENKKDIEAQKAYHLRHIVESAVVIGAASLWIVYPPASTFAFAAAAVISTITVIRHAPTVFKIITQIINSIIYPDSKPWKNINPPTVKQECKSDLSSQRDSVSSIRRSTSSSNLIQNWKERQSPMSFRNEFDNQLSGSRLFNKYVKGTGSPRSRSSEDEIIDSRSNSSEASQESREVYGYTVPSSRL